MDSEESILNQAFNGTDALSTVVVSGTSTPGTDNLSVQEILNKVFVDNTLQIIEV